MLHPGTWGLGNGTVIKADGSRGTLPLSTAEIVIIGIHLPDCCLTNKTRVGQDPKGLEDLTGLTELQRQAAEAAERMDLERVNSFDNFGASDEAPDEWTAL